MDRQARSPGKLILSGEHSVVQGAPALAMAINREVRVFLRPLEESVLRIGLPGREASDYPLHQLDALLDQARITHHTTPEKRIENPEDLLAVCAALLHPTAGAELRFETDIPLGAGLGSSAAFILALLQVLKPALSRETLQQLAVEGEHFQHGRSSGLDVAVSLFGGLQLYQAGHVDSLNIKQLPDFKVFDTGRPQSSTGECVCRSRQEFQRNAGLQSEFTRVTRQCLHAIEKQDVPYWEKSIRENHQLLCRLGVVPDSIQKAVSELEKKGFSAKVCGAGSVEGDAAGMVMVSGNNLPPVPQHWKALHLELSMNGTRLFS